MTDVSPQVTPKRTRISNTLFIKYKECIRILLVDNLSWYSISNSLNWLMSMARPHHHSWNLCVWSEVICLRVDLVSACLLENMILPQGRDRLASCIITQLSLLESQHAKLKQCLQMLTCSFVHSRKVLRLQSEKKPCSCLCCVPAWVTPSDCTKPDENIYLAKELLKEFPECFPAL